MSKIIKLLSLITLAICLVGNVNGQKQKQKPKAEKTSKDSLPVKPPGYPPPNVTMDTVSSEELQDMKIDLADQPPIDFDTTDVPQDNFTILIKKLLVITKARETDLQVAEKSLKESMATTMDNPATNEMANKFIDRFMFELREGRAARWMEKLYIRNYRALFTPDEIQALIDFYQTSAGQKSLERTKILIQNVMGESRKIGAYLGANIMKKIISEENKK